MRRKLLFSAVMLLGVLAVVEGASRVLGYVYGDAVTWFDPAQFALDDETIEGAASYYFDPSLGWKNHYDTPFGERPMVVDRPTDLMATFGDSYTYCDEVEDHQTWQTYLAEMTESDIFNFGCAAYGPDQALLRFRQDYPVVKTPVVALGFTTENIKRVVNRYRKFFYPKTGIPCTKPRFLLVDGELRLIENPVQSIAELERLKDPSFLSEIGENDLWFNRDHFPRRAFPYSRLLLNRSFWLEVYHGKLGNNISDLDPRPWTDLWQDEESRRLMFAIFDSFIDEARAMDAEPLIMILPKERQVKRHFKTGRHSSTVELILGHFERQRYPVFDGVAALSSVARDRDEIASFYDGHLSPEGNRRIAEALFAYLEAR